MKEREQESQLPKGYRWDDLMAVDGVEQLTFYRKLLLDLGEKGNKRVKAIYLNANTALRQPKNLNKLLTD